MRRKVIWLALVAILLTLLIGAGVAQAQELANYNLTLNSLAGGNYGGTTLTSASYTMVVSNGTMIKVSASGAKYSLCSGFICQSDASYFQMHIPSVAKSPE